MNQTIIINDFIFMLMWFVWLFYTLIVAWIGYMCGKDSVNRELMEGGYDGINEEFIR